MAEFVRYTLDDGSEVLVETAESDLVAPHGGSPDWVNHEGLQAQLDTVARAAEQVAAPLKSRLRPEEISLEFGLKVSGEVNWWFFAKNQAEGTIKVTLKWNTESKAQPQPESQTEPDSTAQTPSEPRVGSE